MATILPPVPQFFKVVVFPPDHGLKLPDAFTKKYRDELKNFVFLKVPNGESWEVELVHDENGCYLLQNGWKEFAEFYSIELYYFLVFQYESDSQFLVLIFDPTALEISYPPFSSSSSSSDMIVEVEQKEIVEVHHQTSSQRRRRSCPRVKKPAQQVKQSYGLKKDMMKKRAKIYRKKHEAKSSRPFFISFMHHNNVSRSPSACRLEIPKKFLRENLPTIKEKYKFLLRRLSKDDVTRNWSVDAGVDKGTGRVKIVKGFYKFVKDNEIKLNDACVFELCHRRQSDSGRIVFYVTLYPYSTSGQDW